MIQPYIIAFIIIPMAAVSLAGWGKKIKSIIHPTTWHKVQMKPIDCAFCLAFWLNIFVNPFSFRADQWVTIILYGLASSIIAKKVEDIL